MPTRSRLFVTDEELGKRDDDHKPGSNPLRTWQVHTWRKRRVLGVLALCFVAYIFIHNIPTGLGSVNDRIRGGRNSNGKRPTGLDPRLHGGRDGYKGDEDPVEVVPPTDGQKQNVPAQNYEGPIRFYYLASSLHSIARTMGHRETNRNILFAAADLKSAAALIPLACEMGGWDRNYVHFAIMGRDAMSIDEIKEINGATEDACNIFWHDGRPDYSPYSNDKRMETSVAGAMGHIEKFMHPQAIITTDSATEDDFFTRGMRKKTKELHLTLIAIPHEPERLSWLTRLDARALNAWHTASIDIVVQAPPASSGSLVRLLKSLETADYAGFIPPRLTIELPHTIDEGTKGFLNHFEWPPAQYTSRYSHGQNQQLILRRRIPEHKVNADEASTRFIESFYPSDPKGSHVLVLSSQAELSPVFYHYLKYHLLEYRYSSSSALASSNLIGISLESPSIYLNGTEAFSGPPPPPLGGAAQDDPEIKAVRPFLWQAPNSNAALYFSREWMEIHSFLSKRQTATRDPRTRPYLRSKRKEVSGKSPAWMEYFLELMRARGYFMLYPGLLTHKSESDPSAAESLVIVHNDLYKPPEEFTPSSSDGPEINNRPAELPSEDAILVAPDTTYLSSHHSSSSGHSDTLNHERPLLRSLVSVLSPSSQARVHENQRVLPPCYDLKHMTLLDFKGQSTFAAELAEDADVVATNFRRDAGACRPGKKDDDVDHHRGSAEDLFCITETRDDEEEEEAEIRSRPNSRPPPDRQPSRQETNPHFVPAEGRQMTDLEEGLAKEYSDRTGNPVRQPAVPMPKDPHEPPEHFAPADRKPSELEQGLLDSWADKIRHAAEGLDHWAHKNRPDSHAHPHGKEGADIAKDEDDTSEEWVRERQRLLSNNQREGPLRSPGQQADSNERQNKPEQLAQDGSRNPPRNLGATRGDMADRDSSSGLDDRTGQPIVRGPVANARGREPPPDEESRPFRQVRTDQDPGIPPDPNRGNAGRSPANDRVVNPGSRQEMTPPNGGPQDGHEQGQDSQVHRGRISNVGYYDLPADEGSTL